MLPYISTNNISELNDLIYAGGGISVWENWGPLQKYEEKGWEVQLETQMKKSTKTSQNGKTERSWDMWEK